VLIPTSNESHLRTQCDNKEGESIPSFQLTACKRRLQAEAELKRYAPLPN